MRAALLLRSALLGIACLGIAGPGGADIERIVYVSPTSIGVNPFLIMGKAGAEQAGDALGATVTTVESDTAQSKLENVSAAANDGADIVIVLGFEFIDIVTDVAPIFPDTDFLIVDSCLQDEPPDNVHCAVFREYESAFLVGMIAALSSDSGRIGTIGALDIPFMHRFSDGFALGAEHAVPGITVQTRWIGGQNPFSDPVRSKEQALALGADGVDVIFAAAGGGNFGIYEAAQQSGFKAIAVDVNHCPEAPGLLLDSALKRVDEVIVRAIERIASGEPASFAAYGLAEEGVGAIALGSNEDIQASECLIADAPDVIARVQAAAAEIADGSLVIEDPMFAQ